MPYINELTNPKESTVTKLLPRPKGLIIQTDDYDCFLYKDNKLCKKLLELYKFFRENEDSQCSLVVVPNKALKVGFSIELGEPYKWFKYDEKLQTYADEDEEEIDFVQELKNKIIAPSQHSSPEQSSATDTRNGSTKRRKTL